MSNINNSILNKLRIKKLNEAIDEDNFKKQVDEIISELIKERYDPEIYVDYHDVKAIEENTELIQNMIDSNDPMGIFDDYTYDGYAETESDFNWSTVEKIYKRLRTNDESLPEWADLDYDLQEYIHESVMESLPAYVNSHNLLSDCEFRLDVIIKGVIGNYETAVELKDDKVIGINAELEKFLKLFGYSAQDFISYINDQKSDDKFLNDLIDELKDSNDDNVAVFAAEITLEDLIEIKEAGFVQIKAGCNGGLFDPGVGAGSSLNLTAPKNVDIELKDVELYCDKELRYGLDEIYGLNGNFWKKGFIA